MISAVLPIYDRTNLLKESIESILQQTHRDFELILISDGSPPDTIRVIEGYRANPKIRHLRFAAQSGGPARGRNAGILIARGEWIAFQDSDDISEPRRFELSLEWAGKHNADVLYGAWKAKIDGPNHAPDLKDGQIVGCPETTFDRLKEGCIMCQGTVMAKRSALLAVGGLKERMLYMEDYELWLRLCFNGYKFQPIPELLTTLRIHSSNHEKKFKAESAAWKKKVLEEYLILGDLKVRL